MRLSTSQSRRHLCAFSLIETLLVIGGLLVLAALATGLIGNLRKRAEQVQCSSNLRALWTALVAYQQDHRQFFPKAWDGSFTWYGEGSLGAYVPATLRGPYVCPSVRETTYSLGRNNYVYNHYLGEYGGRRITPSHIPHLHTAFVIADGTGPNYFVSIESTEVHFGWNHGGRGNWLFADGHIRSVGPGEYQRTWIRFPMQ